MPKGHSKIAIIGAGSVGSTTAYACLLLRAASTIVMVDVDSARVASEVADLSDAAFITDSRVKVGDLQEAGQCDVIIITAGAKQKPGESRTNLIARNHGILSSVIGGMQPLKPTAVLLLVANPVDVLTSVSQTLSGLPRNQVFGSGTFLDSQRLRHELSKVLQVAETSVHAFVLGEHGDSQFVAWSASMVAGTPLLSLPQMASVDRVKMATDVRTKAYAIIQAKGSTFYGIGGCVAQIVKAVLNDTHQVMPVSHFVESLGTCISVPAIVGASGVLETLIPPLSAEETLALETSAKEIKGIVDRYA